MRLCTGAIHTHGESRQTRALQPLHNIPREKRCCTGRKRSVNTCRSRMVDQLKQVRALDRVVPGENKYRHLPGRDLIDQRFSFGSAQLPGIALGLGGSTAMYAGKIARLGNFPDGDEGSLVEIDGLDLRIHKPIKAGRKTARSDESRSFSTFFLQSPRFLQTSDISRCRGFVIRLG
jgi:hypothetical protein